MLAGLVRLTNRMRRMRLGWLLAIALLAALVWLITRPFAAAALAFLGERAVLGFIVAALHAATSVARLRPRFIADRERSWLAALPHRVPVSARISFGFCVQALAIAALFASIAATSEVPWSAARSAWLGVLGGYVAGALFGWLQHRVFPAHSSESSGSQYAIVREPRKRWAVAPALFPLSYWAAAWARTLSNPSVTARTLIVVLLGIPMGTPGEVVLAAAGGWMAGLYVLMNLVATVRTAFAAGWWLRPTPVRFVRFTGTLVSRTLVIQLAVFAAGLVAIAAAEKPKWNRLAPGVALVWVLFYVGIAMIACALALQPKRHSHWWSR
ncbi:MAG: hypothetical protein WDO56_35700 [Gammaproteobacteria bacterium]